MNYDVHEREHQYCSVCVYGHVRCCTLKQGANCSGSLRLPNLRVVPAHVVHLNCHLTPHYAMHKGLYNSMVPLTEKRHKRTLRSW